MAQFSPGIMGGSHYSSEHPGSRYMLSKYRYYAVALLQPTRLRYCLFGTLCEYDRCGQGARAPQMDRCSSCRMLHDKVIKVPKLDSQARCTILALPLPSLLFVDGAVGSPLKILRNSEDVWHLLRKSVWFGSNGRARAQNG